MQTGGETRYATIAADAVVTRPEHDDPTKLERDDAMFRVEVSEEDVKRFISEKRGGVRKLLTDFGVDLEEPNISIADNSDDISQKDPIFIELPEYKASSVHTKKRTQYASLVGIDSVDLLERHLTIYLNGFLRRSSTEQASLLLRELCISLTCPYFGHYIHGELSHDQVDLISAVGIRVSNKDIVKITGLQRNRVDSRLRSTYRIENTQDINVFHTFHSIARVSEGRRKSRFRLDSNEYMDYIVSYLNYHLESKVGTQALEAAWDIAAPEIAVKRDESFR